MDTLETLLNIALSNNGIITTLLANEKGISRAVLSKLYKNGKIVRIAKGQYIMPNDLEDEMLSLSKRTDYLIFFS